VSSQQGSKTGIRRVTIRDLFKAKADSRKLTMVTCYDSAFAKLIDESSIDMVLVGDSLGNVVLGYSDTTRVTMDDMVHHTRAVSRKLTRPFLIADMPFLSYKISDEESLRAAGRLVQEGHAQAVKVEGGREIVSAVKKIVDAGIPVVGHLGLLPQSVHAVGGYRVVGKTELERERILQDAKILQDAGVCALVLEMVPETVSREVTASLEIPTIGIGAGSYTDGQVLVLHDLLGFDSEFSPRFLKKYADIHQTVKKALEAYHSEVVSGEFPMKEHSF
jgi:3-methyl-2-oxobutanoate hydroxymethyltransferase